MIKKIFDYTKDKFHSREIDYKLFKSIDEHADLFLKAVSIEAKGEIAEEMKELNIEQLRSNIESLNIAYQTYCRDLYNDKILEKKEMDRIFKFSIPYAVKGILLFSTVLNGSNCSGDKSYIMDIDELGSGTKSEGLIKIKKHYKLTNHLNSKYRNVLYKKQRDQIINELIKRDPNFDLSKLEDEELKQLIDFISEYDSLLDQMKNSVVQLQACQYFTLNFTDNYYNIETQRRLIKYLNFLKICNSLQRHLVINVDHLGTNVKHKLNVWENL